MKNTKVIELKGINRSGGRFTDLGILQECINVAKRRSPLYEVIGKKEVQAEYPRLEGTGIDLEGFNILYRFPSLPRHDLIGASDNTGKVYRITETAVTEILTYTNTIKQITHLGNILIVHTADGGYMLKYDPVASTFTTLPDIPVPRFYCMADTDRASASYDTDVQTTLQDAIAEYIHRDSQLKKDGYANGNVMAVLAYRLFDNSYIKHSQFSVANIGSTPVLDKSGGYSFTGIVHYKMMGEYEYYTADLTTLEAYKGIIVSLCLFIATPVPRFTVDTDESLYTQIGATTEYNLPPNSDVSKMDQSVTGFYKVHEISLEDITSGSEAVEFFPNIGPLDLLVTRTPLPVDESTHHLINASHAYLYNRRLHYANIRTVLSQGLNMDFYSDVNALTVGGYAKAAPADDWTLVETTKIQTTNGELITYKYFYHEDGDFIVWEKGGSPDMMMLNNILSYPDFRASSMTFYLIGGGKFYRVGTYGLTPNTLHNFSSYLEWDDVNLVSPPISIDLTAPGTEISEATFLAELGSTGRVLQDTNRIQVTGLDNPFTFPSANSYRVGTHNNEVMKTCAMGEAISQGQFGEFPLYVFTKQGVWAMQVGSGEVIYNSILPLNSDVVSNLNSIVNVGAGVVYATSRGLFLISGNQVSELSAAVEGKLDNPVLDYNEYLGYLHTDCLVMLKDYLSDIPFSTYLASAIVGFDRKNRELIVSFKSYNDLHDWQGSGSGAGGYNWPGTGVGLPMVDDATRAGYSYVYSFLSGEWTKITQRFYHFLDDYPDTLGVVGNCLYNLTMEVTGANQYMIQTRPITIAQHTFKNIRKANLYGHFEPIVNTFHAFYCWGSQDGQKWALLQGQQQPFSPHEWITIQQAYGWCKYFIFLAAGQLSQDSILEHIEIEFDERYKSKLR